MIKRKKIEGIQFAIVNYTVFYVFALICIFPFYYIIINTISDNTLVARGHILFLPSGFHLTNYAQVFRISGLLQATFISVARTLIGTIFSIISASFVGYAMTKKEFWHRKFWYRYFIITMYFNAGIIPWYMTMLTLGLHNNFLAYVLPALTVPFYMILVKTYIESIPSSLEESAEIDGAGYLRRYFSIVFPISKPIIATVAIFAAVGQWNSFVDTVFLITNKDLYTLQFLLYRFLNESALLAEQMRRNPSFADVSAAKMLTPVAIRFTVTAIVVLPVLLIYPIFQKHFVKGIMIGAIKG